MLGAQPIESDFPPPSLFSLRQREGIRPHRTRKSGDYIDNDPRFGINYELLIFSSHTPCLKLPE